MIVSSTALISVRQHPQLGIVLRIVGIPTPQCTRSDKNRPFRPIHKHKKIKSKPNTNQNEKHKTATWHNTTDNEDHISPISFYLSVWWFFISNTSCFIWWWSLLHWFTSWVKLNHEENSSGSFLLSKDSTVTFEVAMRLPKSLLKECRNFLTWSLWWIISQSFKSSPSL